MLIQVDVDSTLYDADPLFAELARAEGIQWIDRDNQWRPAHELCLEDGSPCDLPLLIKVFNLAHSREYAMKQVPFEGAAEVLARIADDYPEVEIAYVSDRPGEDADTLTEWLSANGFLVRDNQEVVATKDKREWMREHGPNIVIDDRVRTILFACYELGAMVLTLEHNHNINLKGEAPGVRFGKTWYDLEPLLRETIETELGVEE